MPEKTQIRSVFAQMGDLKTESSGRALTKHEGVGEERRKGDEEPPESTSDVGELGGLA